MAKIKTFRVIPYLPEKLNRLMDIANNMWWVWNFEAIELFRRLDIELWKAVEHNPHKLLGSIAQNKLDEAAESESFIAHMERVLTELNRHLTRKSWFEENFSSETDARFAYFSAEFGIHESLPIYSGGLGILAGDHLKSASELGLPLVGVGLFYRFGYFRQYLNIDGWQQERLPETDFHNLPAHILKDDSNKPIEISVELAGRDVYLHIWKINVGRIKLYLLDANIEKNNFEDREITDQLYGGDEEMRIKQEIILGIGGVRALKAVGEKITVYHMNEGHAAFLSIERINDYVNNKKLSFKEAMEFVGATNAFTTHTPVPAGNDRFDATLIDKYFSNYYGKLQISRDDFLALGREDRKNNKETFCMTVLAIKTAAGNNGVSKLHGSVSRGMWKNLWPSLPEHEVPIGHITNGVHTLSWTSDEMMRLYNRYLGPRWIDNPADNTIWENIDDIPDSELWRCKERSRERLVAFVRLKLKDQLRSRGVSPSEVENASSVLDPEALTIGFARRFATYKRATLILRDLKKLYEILSDKGWPVQIIFAGKAHPRDNMGKELIKQVIHLTKDERFRNKIVFLEDYDINVARYLVQGVDIWLNTPIRPKEASGTSGMKVIPNGGLNISILDGWWDEAYNTKNGWAIGKGEEYSDHGYQDEVESLSLYNILKNEVKPLFYKRGLDGLPREWLSRIRESMKSNNPVFNTNRMVQNYTEKYYLEAHKNHQTFVGKNYDTVKSFVVWKNHVKDNWDSVKILNITKEQEGDIKVGFKVEVKSEILLGNLKPEDVLVELYFGIVQGDAIKQGASLPMQFVENGENGSFKYKGQMLCLQSGQFGFTVRVLPNNKYMSRKFEPELLIKWA